MTTINFNPKRTTQVKDDFRFYKVIESAFEIKAEEVAIPYETVYSSRTGMTMAIRARIPADVRIVDCETQRTKFNDKISLSQIGRKGTPMIILHEWKDSQTVTFAISEAKYGIWKQAETELNVFCIYKSDNTKDHTYQLNVHTCKRDNLRELHRIISPMAGFDQPKIGEESISIFKNLVVDRFDDYFITSKGCAYYKFGRYNPLVEFDMLIPGNDYWEVANETGMDERTYNVLKRMRTEFTVVTYGMLYAEITMTHLEIGEDFAVFTNGKKQLYIYEGSTQYYEYEDEKGECTASEMRYSCRKKEIFYLRSQNDAARILEKINSISDDTVFTVTDSYLAGNCAVGTSNFMKKYNLKSPISIGDLRQHPQYVELLSNARFLAVLVGKE